MTPRRLLLALVVAGTTLGCAQPQADPPAEPEADEATLRDSFANRIATSSFVTDFSRDGDTLRFTGPDGQGGTASWVVRIDTAQVEPNQFDDAMPYQGHVIAEWHADGEVVEYLGTMTALPQAFLDRGLAQECWAYWIDAEHRWDW